MIVHLASWPRSGNTLLRAILWHCFGLESYSANDEASRFANCADWHSLTGAASFRRMKDLAIASDSQGICPLKTHALPVDALAHDAPAMYVLRDGREACVSYWKYYHDILEDRSKTLEDVIRGRTMHGSWSSHVQAWLPKRPDVLLVQYERILLHFDYEVCRIARFIKRSPDRTGLPTWDKFHAADPKFFRSGRIDTWRELMTGDDLDLFYRLHGDTMEEYGYLTKGASNGRC